MGRAKNALFYVSEKVRIKVDIAGPLHTIGVHTNEEKIMSKMTLDETVIKLNEAISSLNISDAEAIEMSKVAYLGNIAVSLERIANNLEARDDN